MNNHINSCRGSCRGRSPVQNNNCIRDQESVCGTSIDLSETPLSDERPGFVYLEKLFSFNRANSCPLFLSDLKASTLTGFQVFCETEDHRCDCRCISCVLDEEAEFIVEEATATLDFIGTRPPGNISPSQITICGENPETVTFANHRFTVNAAVAAETVQNDLCLSRGEPTRCLFFIRNVGPWEFRATYVITGLMNNHGRTCRFRAVFTNSDGPFSTLPGNCANFAVQDVAIPCAVNGVAPDITFQFSGAIELINPRLKVCCRNSGTVSTVEAENACLNGSCAPGGCVPGSVNQTQNCRLTLCTNLVVIPSVQVEVVRKTLFSINAREVLVPCDQSSPIVMGVEEEECSENRNCSDVQGESCVNVGNLSDCRSTRTAFQFMGSNGCSW